MGCEELTEKYYFSKNENIVGEANGYVDRTITRSQDALGRNTGFSIGSE